MKHEPQKTRMLLAAVLDNASWLERFNRNEYSGAYRAYKERFGSAWMEAAHSAGEEDLPDLAEALLNGMDANWNQQRFWNRTTTRLNIQQMLVYYLSPMLLDQMDPLCSRLAELIQENWAVRRPKEAYKVSTYRKIQKGFRYAILGIPIPGSNKEEEED